MKNARSRSFLIVTIHYLISIIIGWLTYRVSIPFMCPLWALFVADAVATIYIWILGLFYRNVSFYDPYWSVAPPLFLTAWSVAQGTPTMANLMLLFAVWFWAIRLTANWAITFKGLSFEDWRYSKFRNECHPFIFQLINFFGLNMVPTIVVFLAMVPAFDMLASSPSLTIPVFIGFVLCLSAVVIQLISDHQAHRFRREHPGKVCNIGLWKQGRHPNYFGEIAMWWGVWLMSVSVTWSSHSWYVVGPLSVSVLFCVVSIPLMEKRQLANKPEYKEYKKHTRMFI